MLTIKNIKQFSELAAKLEEIYKQQEEFGALFGWKIDMEIEEVTNNYGGNNLLFIDTNIDSDYATASKYEFFRPASDIPKEFIQRVKGNLYDCVMHVMTTNKQFKEV